MQPPQLLPWTLTPDEFGQQYAPERSATASGVPIWRYPLSGLEWRGTRAAAVADAHQRLVLKALTEGAEVPAPIRALYDPALPPPTAPAPADEPDFTRLAGPAPANLATARAIAPELAERMIANSTTTTAAIEALARRQDAQQNLLKVTLTGMVKALSRQADHIAATAAVTRNHSEAVAEAVALNRERLDAAVKKIAAALAAPRPAKTRPKSWTFKINRDAQGFIASIDATPIEE